MAVRRILRWLLLPLVGLLLFSILCSYLLRSEETAESTPRGQSVGSLVSDCYLLGYPCSYTHLLAQVFVPYIPTNTRIV